MKKDMLGSIVSISKGRKHSVSERASPKSRRLVGIDDLRNDILIRYTDDKAGTEALPEDVLIAWDGANAGTVGYGKSGFIGSTIARLRVKEGNRFYTPFLGLFLQTKFNYLRQTATGATIPHINRRALDSIVLPKIGFDDQIRIAYVLCKIEGLIAQRKQHLQQLDDLLKSVFLEMFGDPVRNEKGWNKKPLEQLGNLDRGVSKHRPRNAPELLGGRYPLIQTGEVSNAGTYITTYTQTYSELGFSQSKLWPAGTLCITIAANIAQTSILTFDACFPDSVVGFSSFESESNALYVHGLFWFFQRILEKNAPAAAQKNINLKILRELNVPAPPPDLQNEFASIVERVEGIKSHYQQSLDELDDFYGALSQKAFKGELDLSRVPLPAEQESSVAREQRESEHAKHVEQNVPENINATLANLNALNASAEGLKAIADLARPATFNLVQQDALRAIAEKMASLRSPLQELKQIDVITEAMERAQAALKPLNLEHIDALTKSVELAHTLTASLPHIDMTWFEHHTEAMRKAMEPFESMRKAMERIALPTIELPDSIRLASEAARRLQSSIPDFNAWQQQSADLPGAELDDEEGGVKRRFTREDLNAIFAQSTGSLSFETLFNQLNELETVDLSGYETIKAILFELLAEQRLSQEFDEKAKTLLLAAHNPEAAH